MAHRKLVDKVVLKFDLFFPPLSKNYQQLKAELQHISECTLINYSY